ncbi:odorant receptor 83a-like [Chelonus insularis]|uniref:odorant receptor 83a-like n=1 Tax=Chelonus insularis TaxID=460826 RepID=UPI00158934D1|nr:odorant receptor 83a-like [Chelonus insularis]
MSEISVLDYRKALNLKILGLRFFGFWHPRPSTPIHMRLFYQINHVIAILLISFYVISVLSDLMINMKNFSVIIEDVLFLILVFMVTFKLYTFKTKSIQIESLTEAIYEPIDNLRSLSNKRIVNIIEYTVYYEHLIDKYSRSIVIAFDLALFSVLFINSGKLPVRGVFPFDTAELGFYILAVIIQIGTAIITSIFIVLMDQLLFSYVRWINSQLQILQLFYEEDLIDEFLSRNSSKSKECTLLEILRHYDVNFDDMTHKLRVCFKIHHFWIDVIAELNSIFSISTCVQVFISCCMICLACVQITMNEFKTQYQMLFLLGAALMQLFCTCWFGSELIDVSNHMSDSIWASKWENNFNVDIKNFMLMSITIAKNPLEIKAGKFFVMSLETFIVVLRCAYSFFVMLSTVNAD